MLAHDMLPSRRLQRSARLAPHADWEPGKAQAALVLGLRESLTLYLPPELLLGQELGTMGRLSW